MNESILLKREGGRAELMLNRPTAFNAFDFEMIDALANRLITLTADDSVETILIGGQGRAFSAGGDLRWALNQSTEPSAAFHELAARFHQAIREIRRTPKPVIAAINGIAAGGGFSLALACDFRVMAESAVLRQGFTSNGLSIDGGGTFSLPRMVGLARALEIAAFDRPISAKQALDWGLVTKIVPDDQALVEARAMAADLASRSLNAFGLCKRLMTDSFNTAFEAQVENERLTLAASARHSEGGEGLNAFVEKRTPDYRAVRKK